MIRNLDGVNIEMTAEEEAEFIAGSPPSVDVQMPIVASIYASAKFVIDGDDVSGMDTSSGLSGAFKADVGSYMVFFTTSQPDTNYIAQAFDGGLIRCYVKAEDYGTDYLTITTTDLQNVPADPTSLSLIVTRVN